MHFTSLVIETNGLHKPAHDTGDQHKDCKPHQLAPCLTTAFEYLETIDKDGFASAVASIGADDAGAALESETMIM